MKAKLIASITGTLSGLMLMILTAVWYDWRISVLIFLYTLERNVSAALRKKIN